MSEIERQKKYEAMKAELANRLASAQEKYEAKLARFQAGFEREGARNDVERARKSRAAANYRKARGKAEEEYRRDRAAARAAHDAAAEKL